MQGEESFLERTLWVFLSRISGRTAVVLGTCLYGLGVALPLIFHWKLPYLVELNAVCTVWAFLILTGWYTVRLRRAQRRNLLEWTSNLRLLTAEEFEWMVGEVFRRKGWTVKETGRQDAADGNIDLELSREGRRAIVQCKRWTSQLVGVKEIREFAGTLMREGLEGNAGWFVTLSDFTSQARSDAKQLGIELIDKHDLYSRIEEVRRTEPCPICETPMIVDHSRFGWWMRCNKDGCNGKRDLASEPGRVIDLLTQRID